MYWTSIDSIAITSVLGTLNQIHLYHQTNFTFLHFGLSEKVLVSSHLFATPHLHNFPVLFRLLPNTNNNTIPYVNKQNTFLYSLDESCQLSTERHSLFW